ncbi:MarR family winged helix-turn-helix transcriptional regulator [Nakamurella lactea]|uniref:MarR family winged helix-turn-helix transcriptional regulator n=1 Tax=Nakamurella lactea TaxID=459515 RepID=UPI0004134342|nr:MarR family transcriptional regulator [Nakamurella lactea]
MRHGHGEAQDPADMTAGELLTMLARRLRHLRGQELQPFGLTPAQSRALATVARSTHRDGEELRLSGLAERLGIAPRSATEVVDALQEKGLVQRAPSPTDRRATALSLTAEGRQLIGRLRAAMAQASREKADDMFSVLSQQQRDALTELLRTVAQHDPAAPAE